MLPQHRATPANQIHLTLQFIGETRRDRIDHTIASVERACKGLHAFNLTPRSLVTLPNRPNEPARLLAVETDKPPTLLELKQRLALRLARKVRDEPARRFRPHLTLCRFTPPAEVDPPEVTTLGGTFAVNCIAVMRSRLLPTGAVHDEIAAIDLSAA